MPNFPVLAIIAGLVAIIGSVKSFFKWKELSRWEKILAIASICGVIVLAVSSVQERLENIKLEKINAKSGMFKAVQSDRRSVGLGSTASQMISTNPNVDALFGTALNKFLKTRLEDGKLYVSFTIRDETGKKIFSVVDNRWTIYDYTYDYNYDCSGIELKVPVDDRIVFHFEFKDDVAVFAGLLVDDSANGFFIYPGKLGGGMQLVYPIGHTNRVNPYYDSLKPIFIYPREEYIGRRAKN